ncbi:hypothetical protein E3V36_05515 [Candidatus Marinimicrobia bacterium MT.SAG.2]|nr:hypothetical protein E3V36_05515 [Candidatus Marinimicrobia bacterium MT.SAG.2]
MTLKERYEKMKNILLILLSLQLLVVLVNAQSIELSNLKMEALEEATTTIDHYKNYTKTLDNRFLIKGVKSASKSSTLFKLWLKYSSSIEDEDDRQLVIDGLDRLCGDIAEDLIMSPSPEKGIVGFITYIAIIESRLKNINP